MPARSAATTDVSATTAWRHLTLMLQAEAEGDQEETADGTIEDVASGEVSHVF